MLFDRLVTANKADWRAFTHHAFVEAMADGSLPKSCFQHYLVQDYLFLIHFARAYALAVYKGRSLADIRASLDGLKAIVDVELDLHVRLCGEWGLSADEIEQAPESRATMAYTRYVLETGLRGDLLDLHVALAPCVIGYGDIARRIATAQVGTLAENAYSVWIGEYSGSAYQDVADQARHRLDTLAETHFSEARFSDLSKIFSEATRLETDFWQMGLDCA